MTAEALMKAAPEVLHCGIVEIKGLPIYNPDLEASPPSEWLEFRELIRAADAVLFVTPEHNRSMPTALKNAIDVGSRPYGQSVWNGKAGGVVTISTGQLGGFGANHHLRQSLACLNVPLLQKEAYLGAIGEAFSPEGELASERTAKFLADYIASFAEWVSKIVA